jgi:hypothetical protein
MEWLRNEIYASKAKIKLFQFNDHLSPKNIKE